MRWAIPLLLLVIPLSTAAETDMRFAYWRDQAQPLDDGGLAAFLDDYIGACRGFFDGDRCKDAAAKFRAETTGKKFWSVVREGETDNLRMTEFNPNTNEYTLLITPAFADGGYFLTQGVPDRFDEKGNPLFRVLAVPAKAKPGKTPMQVSKMYEDKIMRVQFVFTPREAWSVDRQGKPVFGVAADVHAILVTVGATGERIGAWYEPAKPKKPASSAKK